MIRNNQPPAPRDEWRSDGDKHKTDAKTRMWLAVTGGGLGNGSSCSVLRVLITGENINNKIDKRKDNKVFNKEISFWYFWTNKIIVAPIIGIKIKVNNIVYFFFYLSGLPS